MKVGKTYIINPLCKTTFANECELNADMLSLIELHGPSFVVDDMEHNDDMSFVTRVTMEDGSKFTAAGKPGSFFEIYEDEFKYFIEVSPQTFLEPKSLHFEVTEANALDVIAEIKEIFDL